MTKNNSFIVNNGNNDFKIYKTFFASAKYPECSSYNETKWFICKHYLNLDVIRKYNRSLVNCDPNKQAILLIIIYQELLRETFSISSGKDNSCTFSIQVYEYSFIPRFLFVHLYALRHKIKFKIIILIKFKSTLNDICISLFFTYLWKMLYKTH